MALDLLAQTCDRVSILGTSFGAEAALVTAALDPRVAAVIAVSPTAYVWEGVKPDGRITSHWTHRGRPLNWLPYLPGWTPDTDPPSYRALYADSVKASPDRAEPATIPVERLVGDLVLVCGGDDRVWPSVEFAQGIVERRSAHDLTTTTVVHEQAGHRAVLPGEEPNVGGMTMDRGGSPAHDAELGRRAWPHIVTALRLRSRDEHD